MDGCVDYDLLVKGHLHDPLSCCYWQLVDFEHQNRKNLFAVMEPWRNSDR